MRLGPLPDASRTPAGSLPERTGSGVSLHPGAHWIRVYALLLARRSRSRSLMLMVPVWLESCLLERAARPGRRGEADS